MTDTIATLKQQLLDLTASHTSGGVSDRQYEAQRAALEKSLLEKVMQDGGGASEKTGGGKRGKRAAGASSGAQVVGRPQACASSWASQQRFISTNHQAASSTLWPVVKMPWPPWMATRLSPKAAAKRVCRSASRRVLRVQILPPTSARPTS